MAIKTSCKHIPIHLNYSGKQVWLGDESYKQSEPATVVLKVQGTCGDLNQVFQICSRCGSLYLTEEYTYDNELRPNPDFMEPK